MRDLAELVKALRRFNVNYDSNKLTNDAADAIAELLRIGAKMHAWIFLNTVDEQAAYDEIGLTDEQNALFCYSGQIILKDALPQEVE